jgi:inhibitor of cysteine peptidase
MRKTTLLLGCLLTAMMVSSACAAGAPAKEEGVYTEQNTAIVVSPAKPQFEIKLKSNPTTGYSWFLREYNSELLTVVQHKYVTATDKKLMGAPGYETWIFQVKPAGFIVPQQTLIRMIYERPWESQETPTQQLFKVATVSDK